MATLLRLGLRREALLFLPIAALVLIALSAFTLFSYRGAVRRLLDERQSEAIAIVERMRSSLQAQPLREEALLRESLSRAKGVAILDLDGLPLRSVGILPAGNLLTGLEGVAPGVAVGLDPRTAGGPVVAAFAPLQFPGRRTVLRVDLAAPTLAALQRSLKPLTWVVLGVNIAVLLLLLLYLRHLLSPIDALMDRARALDAPGADGESVDEVAFLVRSFDRALEALAAPAVDDGEDLEQLERMLAASVESGLLLLDRRGVILALNEVGAELLGVPANHDRRHYTEHLSVHSELAELLRRSVEEGHGTQREECSISRPDGEHTLGLTVHPLRRDDGVIRGWLTLFADLTEIRQKDQERQLSDSLNRVGELTAGLAHELRNALASLRGYLTLIERGGEGEALQDYLQEVRHEADHLHRVLQDFLSFAQPGSTRLEPVDLERIAHRAAADPALESAPVRVIVAEPQGVPKIQGDSQLLERALRNLIHNAVRAQQRVLGPTTEKGQSPRELVERAPVEVRLGRHDGGVELRVLDRGPGIAEEIKDKLFVPFASDQPDGTGLGLALSQRIAQLHGATLTLENRPEGGACALLRFPAGQIVTDSNDLAAKVAGGEHRSAQT